MENFNRLIISLYFGTDTRVFLSSNRAGAQKIKTQKNGNVHRYVYYGCTRSRDINCKSGYLREEQLVEQLVELIDKMDLDELGMREQLEKEVIKNRKFMRGVLGIKSEKIDQQDIDTRNYAKYVLREGSLPEKRELLISMRSQLAIKNKKVYMFS